MQLVMQKYIQKYWKEIHENIQKFLNIKFEVKPHIFIKNKSRKHIYEKHIYLLRNLLRNLFLAARSILVQYWKSETQLTIQDWETKIAEYTAIVKLTIYTFIIKF